MAEARTKETIIVPCKACDANVAATVEGQYEEFYEDAGFAVRWALLRCPKCTIAVLVHQDDEGARFGQTDQGESQWGETIVLHPANRQRELGSAVPEPIRKAFVEARACFDAAKAYTASAIMCRKVLEGVCDSHQAKGNNLAIKLKDLADRGELDRKLYDWVTAVRIVGNEAAHNVAITVSREDASDLLDLAEAVAEYLYTFKDKYETFLKRRRVRSLAGAQQAFGE